MTVELEETRRDAPEARALYGVFVRESDGPLGDTVDLEAEIAAGPPAELDGPGGVLLLARVDGEPAGIGGVRHLETGVAEVKSMFVTPGFRGTGLGRRILAALEQIAAERGCRAVRLDTSDYLTEAIGLYRSAGYAEVGDYNGNRKANLWFERALDPVAGTQL
jgi:GNAT superfamily N-acetyltransferase